MEYIKINPDDSCEVIELNEKNLLKSLYREIRCDRIQVLNFTFGGKDFILIIDEEGKFHRHQIFNQIATNLFYNPWDFIKGPAIVGSIKNDDIAGLDKNEIEVFKKVLNLS